MAVNLTDTINVWRERYNTLEASYDALDSDFRRIDGELTNLVSGEYRQKFDDNIPVSFGNDSDLQIWHNGSNSIIRDAGMGDLRFETNSKISIRSTTSEVVAEFTPNSGVELYHNNVEKFRVTDSGGTVSGNLTVTDLISLGSWYLDDSGSNAFVIGYNDIAKLTIDSDGAVEVDSLKNIQSMDSDTRVNLSLVTLDNTQTLSNKTLTSPAINTSVTGTALASQAEAEAGTVTNKLMTPKRVSQAITALASGGGLGDGQVWQNVNASRSEGVSYQNTQGKPIEVNIQMRAGFTTLNIQVSSDNVNWVSLSSVGENEADQGVSFTVPDGHYYRIDNTDGGGATIWAELY